MSDSLLGRLGLRTLTRRTSGRPTNHTPRRAGPKKQRLMLESLEDRRMLSLSVPVTLEGPAEGVEFIDVSAGSDSETVDKGEFYWYFDEKVPLERLADEIVVRLAGSAPVDQAIADLTREGGILGGLRQTDQIGGRLVQFGGLSKRGRNLDQLLGQLPLSASIEWATPAFVVSESQFPIWLTDEFVVALEPGVTAESFFADKFDDYRPLLGTPDQFIISVPGGGMSALDDANSIHLDSSVIWASPNFIVRPIEFAAPDDTLYGNQWNLNNTGQSGGTADADSDVQEAWDITTGSSSVTIAIIDDGIQTAHPDLLANVWVNSGEPQPAPPIDQDGNGWVNDFIGWDFVEEDLAMPTGGDNDPNPNHDDDDHGTAVAGIAAAVGNNDLGIAGVSQTSKIMPIRLTGSTGVGGGVTMGIIANAVHYAAGRTADGMGTWKSADIINASWGTAPNSTITAAFDWAASSGRQGKGMAVFAAAGNSGASSIAYPASLSSTIAVGASTDEDVRASYSQYGTGLDFVAPGGGVTPDITTTDRTGTDGFNTDSGAAGDYTLFNGTSAASPLAAGIAALMLTKNPQLTPAQIREIMQDSADEIGGVTYTNDVNTFYGHGRVNAKAALDAVVPEINISDVVVTQADSGSPNPADVLALFTLTLGAPDDQNVVINFSTTIGTASSPSDFSTTSGQAVVFAGELTGELVIVILPGAETGSETFSVDISTFSNNVIGDDHAVGTIQPPQANVTIDQVSTTVTATGTPGNDTLKFFYGEYYRIDVNGTTYDVRPGEVSTVQLLGGAGTDHAELNDSPGNDTLTARVEEYASLTDGTYTATANSFDSVQVVANNGGTDDATIYDTAADDTFSARVNEWANMTLTGDSTKYVLASFFEDVVAQATGGGTDFALLYDSAADDNFSGQVYDSPGRTWARMELASNGAIEVLASGFESAQGVATSGGTDFALLYDSAVDDNFTGQVYASPGRTWARMELASNGAIEVLASNFESAQGVASSGGTDHALLYDSTADDTFTGRANSYAKMRLTNDSTIFVLASAFETALGQANSGGTDDAILYDTTGDDTLSGRVGAWGKMWVTSDSSKYIQASSFESIDGNFSGDGDDDVILYDTTRNDTFTADDHWGIMSTSLSSATLRVVNLSDATDSLQIVSNQGGTDVTDILGSLLYTLIETGPWDE